MAFPVAVVKANRLAVDFRDAQQTEVHVFLYGNLDRTTGQRGRQPERRQHFEIEFDHDVN